ncbi:SigE family RNA polymerase sigma factor [Nocardioides sp. GCM10027113]|uniref:SigE family RNA polymerase sigma factor n=1 Tax=unclassified Nocardioides TaxID=2615069 RepID=UPI0036181B2C
MRRDEESFTQFAAASHDRLRRTAYLMCGDWDRAADHVQEGLVRVYVAWPRLSRQGAELAYARKAVVSAFLDSRRRRSSTEVPVSEHPEGAGAHEDPTHHLADRDALMRALAQLPERQRACVVLRFFDDLDVHQTAVAMGCSEGTVKSTTSRALAGLRSIFEKAARDELVDSIPRDERSLPWVTT